MRSSLYSACFFAVMSIVLLSCSKTGEQGRQLRTLDSLGGAVNAAVKELQKTDTALLQKAITRFSYYRQFIQQNVADTISKNEADNLQRFYASGRNLEVFQTNRAALLARASLVNSQLQKLSADIKNSALSAEQAQVFIEQEKNEAAHLSDLGSSQKELFFSGIEEFKGSLRGVEQLIKSHNNGELPVIVKDTLEL